MMIPSHTPRPVTTSRDGTSPSVRGTTRLRELSGATPISPPLEGGVQGWIALQGNSNSENCSLCFWKRHSRVFKVISLLLRGDSSYSAKTCKERANLVLSLLVQPRRIDEVLH